ncbi:MAG: response regulator [Actinomycetota bacterium]|nr:response regulator [Actinomycetota bacterium]
MDAPAILVVEDTELLRKIYTDRLNQDGYETVGAADGLEALAVLRSRTVDLILLDLIMPKMSGLEVIDTVKKDPRTKNIPILILSNLGQESDIELGLGMGAVDYLIKNEAKPADVSEKIRITLDLMGSRMVQSDSFKLAVKDREADADRFIEHQGLIRRFWCPACEIELNLELLPKSDKPGWYDAHLICPMCDKEF